MLSRIRMSGAEKDGEYSQQRSNKQRYIAEDIDNRVIGSLIFSQNHIDTAGYGFQLQSNIGHRADHCDTGADRGDAGAFAVTGGEKVGDRGNALGFCQPHHMTQKFIAEGENQNRADINT